MAKYAKGVIVTPPYPTDDVRLLTKAAVEALPHVFQPGFKYSKAEVLLMDLRQPGEFSDDLFALNQSAEATRVMAVLDQINARWGRGTLRAASVPSKSDWGMRRGDDESKLHDPSGSVVATVVSLKYRHSLGQ